MSFEAISKTQPNVVRMLMNSFKKHRLVHAYLFEGPRGTKKKETAIEFAKLILCLDNDNKPCGVCHNCLRVSHLHHPNVQLVEPLGKIIKKEQITGLQKELSKTSLEAGPRIYIINHIDQMNTQSANSLLKFLEEPQSETYAILLTENVHKILPTIVSRTQVLSFHSMHSDVLKNELIQYGINENEAMVFSNYTNNIDHAFSLASDKTYVAIIDFVKEIMNVIGKEEESVVLYFHHSDLDILGKREYMEFFMSILMMYQQDIIHYAVEKSELTFSEELETIKKIANGKSKEELMLELEKMMVLKTRLNGYINEKLALNNLLLSLERR